MDQLDQFSDYFVPPLQVGQTHFNWGKCTYVMGILNTTPDSFSDGGEFNSLPTAIDRAQAMVQGGAHIIDIGGQSTRPGAETISLQEELARTIPIIRAIRQQLTVPISIDTTRAEVARQALEAGADMINDISGATFEPEILAIAAQHKTPIILMHIRGTPQTMQNLTDYGDLIGEMKQFFGQQIDLARHYGVLPQQIILDPGIGFAKTAEQNITLLRQLPELKKLGFPLLLGPSRKSFIGKILDQPDPKERVWGTGAACCRAIAGGADIVRVHDVEAMAQVCTVADALWR
ncbi:MULTISPECIES: dihydropteroate synthase [unclassified Synechocystis]|uniref:dihydropteroate synthase n=1 Tax=unclassified Synechocystis TaxID=2640012 RepID=UPI0003FC39BE|nr:MULTISPECIES: dihydropteroate synthase [unclassified Synechocystis]AIE74313.1 Dihydropteroate synthase [Synechocystis sp. PCC 6714]MCT0254902.1 dihydropteroate synthase [Synechocystis sp. CS-94]